MKKHFMDCVAQFEGIPYNLETKWDFYLITMLFPSRTKEELKISLINRILNIKASKPKDVRECDKKKEPNEQTYDYCCPMGISRRSFRFIEVDLDIPLPADANEEDIKSAMFNGVLKIKISKKVPKRINIENN
ncbi:MAG: Hsp20/alpha crystallin family protein [Promethearchaeota archaeon]